MKAQTHLFFSRLDVVSWIMQSLIVQFAWPRLSEGSCRLTANNVVGHLARCRTEVIHLSALKHFAKLQMSKLAVAPGIDDEAEPASYQLLSDIAFSCVEHVVIHDEIRCELPQGITMETCFPNMRTLRIKVDSDQRGRNLVQAVLALQKLEVFE